MATFILLGSSSPGVATADLPPILMLFFIPFGRNRPDFLATPPSDWEPYIRSVVVDFWLDFLRTPIFA
jgi:hypothetical protein